MIDQRNEADVKVARVTRVPGAPIPTDGPPSAVVVCDRCGNVPTADDSPHDLQLSMVMSPDRDEPIFLGPICTDAEVNRYLSREPAER